MTEEERLGGLVFDLRGDLAAAKARIAAIAAERDRLRDACNTARLAFAGYVSADTAIRKLDALETSQ